MTCTMPLKRPDFLDLNFKYDTVVFEEAAQILEIESFIPLVLQRAKDIDGHARLKRGNDWRSQSITRWSRIKRFPSFVTWTKVVSPDCNVRVPNIVLDAQGRARKQISKLYSWRYRLDDLRAFPRNNGFSSPMPVWQKSRSLSIVHHSHRNHVHSRIISKICKKPSICVRCISGCASGYPLSLFRC